MAEQQTDLVKLTIDGRAVSVPKGTLIWEAARRLGIEIPIYCYHPKMKPLGACRMCFVGVKGVPKPATACTTVVAPDMEVTTTAPQVQKACGDKHLDSAVLPGFIEGFHFLLFDFFQDLCPVSVVDWTAIIGIDQAKVP